jgi:hypothetical protein
LHVQRAMRSHVALCLVLVACGGSTRSHPDGGGDLEPDGSPDDIDARPPEDDGGLPDAGPPVACGAAIPGYEGPLCGPTPCVLLDDAVIDPEPRFRNGAPSITVDAAGTPAVAYTSAVGGYFGFYATPEESGWTSEALPVGSASTSLARDADDRPLALLYDGAAAASTWRRQNGSWQAVGGLPEGYIGLTNDFLRDQGGCLHATGVDPDHQERGMYMVSADGASWSSALISEHWAAWAPSMTLAPDGTPQLVFWEARSGTWELRWATPGGTSELITSIGNALMYSSSVSIGVTPVDVDDDVGAPFVRHVFHKPTSVYGNLEYLRQSPAGTWETFSITGTATSNFPGDCPFVTQSGETCTYARPVLHSLDLLTAGQEVRLLYVDAMREATAVSECFGGTDLEPPFCEWREVSASITGGLRLAWVQGDGVETASVAEGIAPWSATARIDHLGRIHVAAYLLDETVRYVLLGSE